MRDNVREMIQRHHIRYELLPYYILLDVRGEGAPYIKRRVQAGYDVDLYGVGDHGEQRFDIGGAEMHAILEYLNEVAQEILPDLSDSCFVEITPFETSLTVDPRHQFQAHACLRLRVMHLGALDRQAGRAEEKALEQIRSGLQLLGVSSGAR
ncbi:MAG TPA: hypothetical protein VKV15_05735 [Bryobacteraceae bacterium]|nr:hypothetical protein [Bryobacteraceae bacterium]